MLHIDLKRRRRERSHAAVSTALLSLARAATEDWDESIQQIVQIDAAVIDVERASFWTVSEDGSSLRCDAAYVSSRKLVERGAKITTADVADYVAALRGGAALAIEDVATDTRARAWHAYWAARGVASALHVPVCVEGRVVGILCHEHVGAKRGFRPDQQEFALGVAALVGFAMVSRGRTRGEIRAQRLDNVSRVLVRAREVREVAQRAVDLVVPQIADLALLFAMNRDGLLECLASTYADSTRRALDTEVVHELSYGPSYAQLVSLIVRQNQAILIPELSRDVAMRYGLMELHSIIVKADVQTAIGVPLATGDAPFGMLIVSASKRRYGADDLALVSDIGERVAAALENARLHEVSREAIRARDELLVLTAHELRTPMTALQLATQEAVRRAESSGDERQRAGAETIARHVQRMSAVVEHILDALRIRAEGVRLTREPCDLACVARCAAAAASERAHKAGTRIDVRADAAVRGDWDRNCLDRMLRELLDNAIKFSDQKPIEVTVARDDAQAVLTVRDHGVEIPAERITSIFSPFERAVPKEHYGGLGLGLYIAKAIAEAHGGTIGVTSDRAEGTTFAVRLPCVAATRRP